MRVYIIVLAIFAASAIATLVAHASAYTVASQIIAASNNVSTCTMMVPTRPEVSIVMYLDSATQLSYIKSITLSFSNGGVVSCNIYTSTYISPSAYAICYPGRYIDYGYFRVNIYTTSNLTSLYQVSLQVLVLYPNGTISSIAGFNVYNTYPAWSNLVHFVNNTYIYIDVSYPPGNYSFVVEPCPTWAELLSLQPSAQPPVQNVNVTVSGTNVTVSELLGLNASSVYGGSFVVYFSYQDTGTGLPVCFALRNCTVDFVAVNVTYVNVSVAGETYRFEGSGGIAAGRFYIVPGWSNVTFTFTSDYGASANRTVYVYARTSAKDLGYNGGLTGNAVVYGTVLFSGYSIPAAGETVVVENLNTSTVVSAVAGSDGRFNVTIPVVLGVNKVLVRLAHGGTYVLYINVLAYYGENPATITPPSLNLTPTLPSPGTPGGMMVLSAIIAMWIMMAKMVGWDYSTFIVGAVLTAYGIASRSSVVFQGGMLMMAGGLVLLLWKRSR